MVDGVGSLAWQCKHVCFNEKFFLSMLATSAVGASRFASLANSTQVCEPSPTLSPTDPVPRGLLTLCPWASSGPQGLYTAYIQPIYSLYAAYMQPIYSLYAAYIQPTCSLHAAYMQVSEHSIRTCTTALYYDVHVYVH